MMNNRNKNYSKKALLLSTAFLLLLVGINLIILSSTDKERYALQIILLDDDSVYWEVPVKPNDTFYHEYIHSVELSPVREYFKIDKKFHIVATESWTKSFGAGLPYETKDKLEQKDGFFVIHQERELDYLNLLPSRLYRHSFYFGKKTVDLSNELNGQRIRIQVTKRSVLSYE